MRIFGFEITRSQPIPAVDELVLHQPGYEAIRLVDLNADELRVRLAQVIQLAARGQGYYSPPHHKYHRLYITNTRSKTCTE